MTRPMLAPYALCLAVGGAAGRSGAFGGDRSFNIVDDFYIRDADGQKAPRGRQGTILGGPPRRKTGKR